MDRDAILAEWLAATLATYPDQTARMLRELRDPFRNPVGHVVRESLAAVLEEILGGMDGEKLRAALDGIVRIRAVQDFTPSQAVAFLFALKPILRRHGAADREEAADRAALAAFDVYMACREKLYEARANEARRRFGVLERTR